MITEVGCPPPHENFSVGFSTWIVQRQMHVADILRMTERAAFGRKLTKSIQPAMAYEDGSVLISRPLYRWPA